MKKYYGFIFLVLFFISGCSSQEEACLENEEVIEEAIDVQNICLNEECTMLTQGPNSPGTVSVDSGTGSALVSGGYTTWINPDNIKTSNNSYATTTVLTSGETQYPRADGLIITNFGFNIPSSAIIRGILFEVEWVQPVAGAQGWQGDDQYLIKGGVKQSWNYSDATYSPTSEQYHIFSEGGSSPDPVNDILTGNQDRQYLWEDASLKPSDINNSGFGIYLSFSSGASFVGDYAAIDHVRATVYYDLPADQGMNL